MYQGKRVCIKASVCVSRQVCVYQGKCVSVYIVGYCRGVAIFVTFVDLQVMKFSTH